MQALRKKVSRALCSLVAPMATVVKNGALCRLLLAWAASALASWGCQIAFVLGAYRAGGAPAVGLVVAARLVPGALAAPFAALLADRYRLRALMAASDLARAAVLVVSLAAFAAHASAFLLAALAALLSLCGSVFRPAEAALTPTLARDEAELVAANAAASIIDGASGFVGPALAGIVLALGGTAAVVLAAAAALAGSALLLTSIPEAERPSRPSERLPAPLSGFALVARDSDLRRVFSLYGAVCISFGGLTVLGPLAAIRLLGLGDAGVGYVNAAFGAGALTGGFIAASLAGRRPAVMFSLGVGLFGAPLALLPLLPTAALALPLLALVGIANALVDVTAFTLIQRAAPEQALARVFGLLAAVTAAGIAAGAAAAPLSVAGLGLRGALVLFGGLLPVAALALTLRPGSSSEGTAPAPAVSAG
jgi:MFS family permease